MKTLILLQRRLIPLFCTLAALLLAFSATAATRTLINTGGGARTNAANWSPAIVPRTGDTAFITNNATYNHVEHCPLLQEWRAGTGNFTGWGSPAMDGNTVAVRGLGDRRHKAKGVTTL